MRDHYRTVTSLAKIELEEKKSRFIAVCRPLSTEAEATAFVGAIRQDYPDAAHHVYAWILGGDTNLQRYSDDGEPQGTAGIPVLDVLRKNGIDQAGIVVTRYFGGTKLGAGGLVRAYSRAAAQAMSAAGPVDMQLCRSFQINVGYAEVDRLRRQLELQGFTELKCKFGLDAEMVLAVPADSIEQMLQICADVTHGAALVEPGGQLYRPLPRQTTGG